MHIRRETYSIRQMPLTFHTRWMQRWSELMNSSWAGKWDGSSCKVRGNLRYRRINCTLASEEGDLTSEFLSPLTSSVPVADSGSAVLWSCVSGPANLRAQHLDQLPSVLCPLGKEIRIQSPTSLGHGGEGGGSWSESSGCVVPGEDGQLPWAEKIQLPCVYTH